MNTNDPLNATQGSSSINIPSSNKFEPTTDAHYTTTSATSELSSLPNLNAIPSSNDIMGHPLNSSSSSTLEKTISSSSFAGGESFDSASSQRKSSNEDNNTSAIVQLARRRRSSKSKEKQHQQRKNSALTRPQGRPLSKETRIRLTLVPTLGILYSILVSDTMRKTLKVLKYSTEDNSMSLTNEELSTRNVISGFSSLLNVKTARFSEDGLSYSPEKNATIPKFASIDEAVYNLFGIGDFTLIRVSRAAATEIGGSVLLKIETAMPGYLYLNDDEDEDFKTVEENKDLYLEAIGSKGDRPSTTFLKKKVARPRYKSDMRIYLIPRINSCAIYCEKRMFKRDLLRGFLNMNKLDRSIIVAFNYEEAIDELEKEGYSDLIKEMKLPTVEEFNRSSHLPQSTYPMQPVELSISKQSALQHLQYVQAQQQHHHQQQQTAAPGQQQPYYPGYNFQRPTSNEVQSFYDPAQQSQLSYSFSQQQTSPIYQSQGHQQPGSQLQEPDTIPPSSQPPSAGNSFPQYTYPTYPQEIDTSSQQAVSSIQGFGPIDQQFAQQPLEEIVGSHDPNRRANNQFQQNPVAFYNQQMYPSQVMNPYGISATAPQQYAQQQFQQFAQPQDPNTQFYQ